MKEYLFKGIDGTYKVVDHDCQGRAIEIPEGAVKFFVNNEGTAHFVSLSGQFMADYDIKNGEGYWYDTAVTMEYYQSVIGGTLVWSRHAQPEELPFMDDGPMTEDDFKKQLSDNVNQPQHYTYGTIECIDAIESSMSKEAFAGFLKGNVQKYMWRYENKGGVESLQKAQWYLNRLILLQSAHD